MLKKGRKKGGKPSVEKNKMRQEEYKIRKRNTLQIKGEKNLKEKIQCT